MSSFKITGCVASLVGVCLTLTTALANAQDGLYNEEQATRGQALYYQHCLTCHGETLGGVDKAPQLAGPQFSTTWNNAPLAALVARIQTMPPEKPGTLTIEESVDVLTYMLWYNGLPLGNDPLPADLGALGNLHFQPPAGL